MDPNIYVEGVRSPMEKEDYGAVGHAAASPELSSELKKRRTGSRTELDMNMYPRASLYLEGNTVRTKNSIFAPSLISQTDDSKKRRTLANLASHPAFQCVAFILASSFSGFSPFFLQRVVSGRDEAIRSTPYMVDYMISICLGQCIALLSRGKQGLKDVFDFKAIWAFFPVLLLSSLSEMLQGEIFRYIDGTTWRIVKQIKLPLTAIACYILLGRRNLSLTQWILIMSVSISVGGFVSQILRSPKESPYLTLGLTLAMCSISMSVIAGVMGDARYKSVPYPLYIQVPQGRFTSLACSFFYTFYLCQKDNMWDRFLFGGWNRSLFALSLWFVAKDWTSAFILKHLDSIWKSIAGIVSLIIAFIVDHTVNEKSLDPIAVIFMLSLIANILAFTTSKRDASKCIPLSPQPPVADPKAPCV